MHLNVGYKIHAVKKYQAIETCLFLIITITGAYIKAFL